MSMNIFILVLCGVLHKCYSINVPFIKACKLNEEDCLLTSNMQIAYPYIADGIPEIGVPTTDPMEFENIKMWADHENFTFILPKLKMHGGRKCRVVEFKQNHSESTVKITVDCPLVGSGKYKLNGKFDIFNINKEGDYIMQTDSMSITIIAKIAKIVIKGKKHWNLLSYEYTAAPTKSLYIELAGLFSGDVKKVQPLLDATNNDWATVAHIGQPISNLAVKNMFDAFKTFFLSVPITDII